MVKKCSVEKERKALLKAYEKAMKNNEFFDVIKWKLQRESKGCK